jgi:HPt (histidine-containing phosphotransfer) domain-containing protein
MRLTKEDLETITQADELSNQALESSAKTIEILDQALAKEKGARLVLRKLNEELLLENSELKSKNIELKAENETQQIALDLHANFKSVLRYCDERGLKKTNKELQAFGKALSKISRSNGLEIHKVRAYETCGRYAEVNSYVPRAFEIYEGENLSLF